MLTSVCESSCIGRSCACISNGEAGGRSAVGGALTRGGRHGRSVCGGVISMGGPHFGCLEGDVEDVVGASGCAVSDDSAPLRVQCEVMLSASVAKSVWLLGVAQDVHKHGGRDVVA